MSENPFVYSSPVTDPAHFAGRGMAIAFVTAQLVGAHHRRALTVLGAPQMGKSSLLRVLPAYLDERYCVVRLSLRAGTVAGEAAWLSALAGTVPQAIQRLDITSARLPELPGDAAGLREALRGDYLADGLRAMRRDRHLLVLVDNADRLLAARESRALPRDSFAFLGELLETHANLDLLFAFDARHESTLLTLGAPFSQELMHRLEPLSAEDMAALITAPLADVVPVEVDALDAVYDLTAGHPYLGQVIGWLLFERSEARRHAGAITAADAAAVSAQALTMAGDVLSTAWTEGTSQERLVLTAITALSPDEPPQPVPHEDIGAWLLAAEKPLDPRTVNATWRRLEYEGVLRLEAAGAVVINGGLQRQWLREHVTLEGEGEGGTPWRRLAIAAAGAVLLLMLLLAVVGSLPGPDSPAENGGDATITLDLELQATRDAYDATQTATAR